MDTETVVDTAIQLITGTDRFDGNISGEQNPVSARRVIELLPLEGRPRTEANALLFRIPVHVGVESPTRMVDAGDIAYWPKKHAFCIFFDRPEEEELPSPVNIIGHISDAAALQEATSASEMQVIRAR